MKVKMIHVPCRKIYSKHCCVWLININTHTFLSNNTSPSVKKATVHFSQLWISVTASVSFIILNDNPYSNPSYFPFAGWLANPENRPTFMELEATMTAMAQDPGRYLAIQVTSITITSSFLFGMYNNNSKTYEINDN